MTKQIIYISFLLMLSVSVFGQYTPFSLDNSSFEGTPGPMQVPSGWVDAGFPGETSPDTHPAGIFGVTKRPKEGNSYLGLVTRVNDTWETVAQRLKVPLEEGVCYEFSLYLAKSKTYFSSDEPESAFNYNKGVVLRIWGGSSYVQKKEKLAESSVVDHSDWQLYKFKLRPNKKAAVIFLEAYYKTPVLIPYGGNILIDNISEIKPIDCKTNKPLVEEPIAVVTKPTVKQPKVANHKVIKTEKTNPKQKVIKRQSKYKKIRDGQTVNIDKLTFDADAYDIRPENYKVLDEIYEFLKEEKDLVVEIGGHTNNVPSNETCNRLSTNRAKSVAEYLIKKGISKSRIVYKGYGKHRPKYSNKTSQGRKGNQRVEIRVIRTN